jgi:hypothetical protein
MIARSLLPCSIPIEKISRKASAFCEGSEKYPDNHNAKKVSIIAKFLNIVDENYQSINFLGVDLSKC